MNGKVRIATLNTKSRAAGATIAGCHNLIILGAIETTAPSCERSRKVGKT